MTPPLRIGVPVYNGEQYLDEALASIRSQTFGDFELVLSDNGSTDGTLEIAKTHEAEDPRVRVIANPVNRGSAFNYNLVFGDWDGPYFKWAAADDMMAPTCVERCFDALESSDPDVVLAYTSTKFIDSQGRELREYLDPVETTSETSPHARLRHVVRTMVYGNLCFALMRTAALRRTRLHGAYPSSDLVLLAELSLIGRFQAIDEPLFYRREHEASSRRANTSLEDMSAFFDPNAPPVHNELMRLFTEHLKAIKSSDLSVAERALCYVVFVSTWVRRHDELRERLGFGHRHRARGSREE
jgi:glycosyltransferase involved in cell wall biosynthesis